MAVSGLGLAVVLSLLPPLAAAHGGAPKPATGALPVVATTGAPATHVPAPHVPAPLIDLDALVRIESRVIGADGVLRTSQFEERLMRRGHEVWTRRVIPALAPQLPDEHGHKHFNPLEGGRVIGLQDGKPSLRFVLDDDRVVVAVPSAEFANLGFDGSWERAYYLVTAAELARLKPTRRPSPVAGAVWLEKESPGQYERVLWDPARSVVRVMESGSGNGAKTFKVTVTVATKTEPAVIWSEARGYESRRYSDYLD